MTEAKLVVLSGQGAKHVEGTVEVTGGRIWYESQGEGPAIVLLHGGPGASSDYLKPLMRYADQGFQVVRYDQLGSYRSEQPDDLSLWQVARFVEELEMLRTSLDLGDIHLIGQSWGSFLALEYAISHPGNLRSLVLYSGAASTRECFEGMLGLRATLSKEDQTTLERYELNGDTTNPEYTAIIDRLMANHLCRLDPWPDDLAESMGRMALPVYETMWGPNEFTCTGNLMDWDRSDQLGDVSAPTLVVCGRYDEVVPSCSETMAAGIPDAELVIFENSSHLAHFEEPDAFYPVLTRFLERNR